MISAGIYRRLSPAVLVLAILCLSFQTAAGGDEGDKSIPTSAEDICPILPGQSLPAIRLTALDSNEIDLNALIAQKPTILIFFRGGW